MKSLGLQLHDGCPNKAVSTSSTLSAVNVLTSVAVTSVGAAVSGSFPVPVVTMETVHDKPSSVAALAGGDGELAVMTDDDGLSGVDQREVMSGHTELPAIRDSQSTQFESVENDVEPPAHISFADLLMIHDADQAILDELSRPLSVCLTPINSPVLFATSPVKQSNVTSSEQAGQSSSSEQPTEGLESAADRIVSLGKGIIRKKKSATAPICSTSSSERDTKLKEGRSNYKDDNRKLNDKENLKRMNTDEKTSPSGCRLMSHSDSPKRPRVVRPPVTTESITPKSSGAGNFRIPLRPAQSQIKSSVRHCNNRTVMSSYAEMSRRARYGDRFSGEHGRHGEPVFPDRRRFPTERRPHYEQGFRREELTNEQMRWLAQMPRQWR